MLILCHDTVVAWGCFFVALLWGAHATGSWVERETIVYLTPAVVATAGSTFYLCGLHRRVWSYTSTSDYVAIAKASAWVVAALALPMAIDYLPSALALAVPAQWLILVVALCASRLTYQVVKAKRAAGKHEHLTSAKAPVLVYGCGPMASLFLHALWLVPDSGLRVVGVVDEIGDRVGRYLANVPVLGRGCDLDCILLDLAVRATKPQRIIVATDPAAMDESTRRRIEAAGVCHGVQVDYLQDALGIGGSRELTQSHARAGLLPTRYERVRRFTDIIGSTVAVLVLSPVLVLLVLAVLLDVGPPVLFRQSRPGRHLKPFILYKFRTMSRPYNGTGTLLSDTERTSRLGSFLRRTRLDEIPQLCNVLIGDMSLIGPRPLLPRDLPHDLTERSLMRPGITGWAQVNGGHQLTAPDKLALELWYVRNANLWLDARIVWRTLKTMLFGERVNHSALAQARAALVQSSTLAPAAQLTPQPALPQPVWHDRPHLLIINRFFHPDCSATAQLLTDLVDSLDRQGCAIRVFTGRERYDDPEALLPTRDTFGGAVVRRLRTSHFGRAGLAGRSLDYASFYAATFFALLRTARRGDILIAATDPPLISVVGWLVARLRGARSVNWCHDLFPETAAALGVRFARGPTGRILRRLRNASLTDAAMNVALCGSMARRLRDEGVPPGRITIIHNWADGACIRPRAPGQNALRRDWDLDGRFVLGYSGNLGRVHDADSLVALMDALAGEAEILTLFIGAGHGYRVLRNIFADRDIANVRFRPYQPRARLGESLTAPDLHLVTQKPECEGLVMPSKLYGILAAGRPIAFIGAEDGDAARLVRDHEAGLVAEPRGVARLAGEIRKLRADPVRLARLGANARRAYEAHFSKEASLNAWLDCLQALGAPVRPAEWTAEPSPGAHAPEARVVAAE